MSSIICTVDFIQSFWVGDYILYNRDNLGYTITIVSDNFIKVSQATETIIVVGNST